MAFKVFVSHSMRKKNLRILDGMLRDAQAKGINYYLAERHPQYGKSLAGKIETAIRDCDCFVALWTKSGAKSKYVNQEIGLARGVEKLRIIIVEEGLQFAGFDVDNEYVVLYPGKVFEAINNLNTYLTKLKEKRELIMALSLFLIAVLGFVFLLISLRKNKDSAVPPKSLPASAVS